MGRGGFEPDRTRVKGVTSYADFQGSRFASLTTVHSREYEQSYFYQIPFKMQSTPRG